MIDILIKTGSVLMLLGFIVLSFGLALFVIKG